MIVPSMTLPEIRKALVADYDRELKVKMNALRISSEGKWARTGRKDFAETIQFTTQSGNQWRITVECKKGNIVTLPYLVAYDDKGITAWHFLAYFGSDRLMYFNTHFFKRYKERGKIGIEKPEDVVKHFFRKNIVVFPSYYPMEDGTKQLFCSVFGGVGLGKFHNDADVGEIYEFKTFVDNSLLREDQKLQIQEI